MRVEHLQQASDADLDRVHAETFRSTVERLGALSAAEHGQLQLECDRTVAGRSAAASVLVDALDRPGWRYSDLEVRFPESVQLLNDVLQQELMPGEFSTVQLAAIADAMVVELCRPLAEVTGSRLYITLTAPVVAVIGDL